MRGWLRRYLVPGCLAPKDGGHLDFDDDSGSVRRYRLDLEEVDVGEGRGGWFLGGGDGEWGFPRKVRGGRRE